MINGVSVVWLPVTNIQQALGFYEDTLGLTRVSAQEQWAELDANGVKIGLNSRDEETPGPEGGAVIAFQPQSDLESTVSELEGKGVSFIGGISEHPWGRIAAFEDPDGNSLQFYEPPKG